MAPGFSPEAVLDPTPSVWRRFQQPQDSEAPESPNSQSAAASASEGTSDRQWDSCCRRPASLRSPLNPGCLSSPSET